MALVVLLTTVKAKWARRIGAVPAQGDVLVLRGMYFHLVTEENTEVPWRLVGGLRNTRRGREGNPAMGWTPSQLQAMLRSRKTFGAT